MMNNSTKIWTVALISIYSMALLATAASATYSAENVTAWRYDAHNQTHDNSTNNVEGVLVGNDIFSTGAVCKFSDNGCYESSGTKTNDGITFNVEGSNDIITLPLGKNFTFMAWIKADVPSDQGKILQSRAIGGVSNPGCDFTILATSGNLFARCYDGTNVWFPGTTTLANGVWRQVIMIINVTDGKAYTLIGDTSIGSESNVVTSKGASSQAAARGSQFYIGYSDTAGREFEGDMQGLTFINRTATPGEMQEHFDNGFIDDSLNAAPPPSTTPVFTVNLNDDYDSTALTSYNITIFNATWETNLSTHNGTIIVLNSTTGTGGDPILFDELYSIKFLGNNSAGKYFPDTETNINVTNGITYTGGVSQSILNLYVNDTIAGIGLSSFTVNTNKSQHAGTDGYIILPSKAGYHVFNITSTQYPLHSFEYSIDALQNLSFYANVSPSFNFYLRRESDNSLFDIAGTNTTKLTIYCPTKNIIINFKNTTYSSTQENATIDCAYTLMKMDVSYSGSTYFRTLIPETSDQNVTWWLMDLNLDTGVQIILELNDQTGDWTDGILRLKTAIGANNEDIIEQQFDISTAVTAYLLKDGLYIVSIESNDGVTERQLGSLVADGAGTKTIIYPNLPFYPEESILGDNLSWAYTFNTSSQILRLQYQDSTASTTSIQWSVYNGSNTSQLLQSFSSTASGNVTFTYQPVFGNQSYYTSLLIQHSTLSYNISENRVFGDFTESIGDLQGWSSEEEYNLKFYASSLFLIVWGMLFSAKHVGIGLTSTLFWVVIFKYNGWFPINNLWLGLIGFVAILGWIVEAMRKN